MSRAGRSQWFASRSSQPGKEADSESLSRQRPRKRGAYRWDSLGPFNIGGRSTSLAVDPHDPKRVILGTAGGGVWETKDCGLHWQSIWDDQSDTLNIGSVALDPRDPQIVYAGTGEANLTLDSYPGMGLYRRNKSRKWENIGSTSGSPPDLPKRIGAIAVDPSSQRGHIYVGSATTVEGEMGGLYEGHEGEDGTWKWNCVSGFAFGDDATSPDSPLPPSPPYRCHCVLFHPSQEGVVFTTVNLRGWRSGIWRRRGGGNWEQLTNGLPPAAGFGRTSLAISASTPSTWIWAYAGHRRDPVLGVFFSRDNGDTWSSVGSDHFVNETTSDYVNCIAVHPKDPLSVICGGVDLHRTDDAKSWDQVSEWDSPEDDPHFAHADHHALAVTKDGWVYDANDGGMAFSKDFGRTWETRQDGLVTTMFYDIDVAGRSAGHISGGAQDNGTLVHKAGRAKGQFKRERGADGGWTVFNPDDKTGDRLWGSSQHVNIFKRADGVWSDVTPDDVTDDEHSDTWMTFIAMDTSPGRADPRPVFLGTNRIWKTRDDGDSWSAVSPELDGSAVTAIEVADADSRHVLAGTEDGGIFRSTDGGNTWSENFAGIDLPKGLISRIEAHPADHRRLLLTIGATKPLGVAEAARLLELKTFQSHVCLSTDGGRTWINGDPGRNLPDVPHNCVTFEAEEPHRAFVANDLGVFAGHWNVSSAAYTWAPLIGNLPNTMATDLVYHAKTRTLTAATYGRGIFRLTLKKAARK